MGYRMGAIVLQLALFMQKYNESFPLGKVDPFCTDCVGWLRRRPSFPRNGKTEGK